MSILISDLYKINGDQGGGWENDIYARLRVVVNFISDVISILENQGVPNNLPKRLSQQINNETIYDHVAKLSYEIILLASQIRSPAGLCWSIQHNTVWTGVYDNHNYNGPAAKIIKYKIRRLIYNGIHEADIFPNYLNISLLSFFLNVLRFVPGKYTSSNDSIPLHKSIILWTQKKLWGIYLDKPHIIKDCFVDGMFIDEKSKNLIRENQINKLERKPYRDILLLISEDSKKRS